VCNVEDDDDVEVCCMVLYLFDIFRHEITPHLGYTVPREYLIKDLTLMKQAHINFIRTCHYSNDIKLSLFFFFFIFSFFYFFFLIYIIMYLYFTKKKKKNSNFYLCVFWCETLFLGFLKKQIVWE
jgi:hypothetical protein